MAPYLNIASSLADIFGRKPVILFGSVGFFVSTLACSVANSIEQLMYVSGAEAWHISGCDREAHYPFLPPTFM